MAVRQALGGDWTVAYVSDVEPGPCALLAARQPNAPNVGDITAVDKTRLPRVDVVCGGSPCQSVSLAGLRHGMKSGTRSGLWSHQADVAAATRPALLVWENVAGALNAEASGLADLAEREARVRLLQEHGLCACDVPDGADTCAACGLAVAETVGGRRLTGGERLHGAHTAPTMRALGRVLGDLANLGYDAAWCGYQAAWVGAPHHRLRVFLTAWPRGERSETGHALLDEARGMDLTPPTDPFAVWDRAGDVWRLPMADLFGQGECFTRAWPACGVMAAGVAHAAPEPDHEAWRGLLPTPCATDGERTSKRSCWIPGVNWRGVTLNNAVLDSGEIRLLPTPVSRDGKGPDIRRSDGCLPVAVLDYGRFAPAVRRWETILGRPAPSPTITGERARRLLADPDPTLSDPRWLARHALAPHPAPHADDAERRRVLDRWRTTDCRSLVEPVPSPCLADYWRHVRHVKAACRVLNPRFVEWMMGLPDGWVTDENVWADVKGPTRVLQIRALGNGVVPRQGAAAIRHLLRLRGEWSK